MKPSGIEWIGDIPDDWEVIKTKFLFNVYGGSTPKVNVPEYWGDKIIWITPGELGDDIKIVLNSKRMLSEKGLNSCGATLAPKGSIIISNRAPIGQVCLAGRELCTNQGCKSLVAKIKLSCLFFYYFFKVQSEVLNMLGNGTTFMELSASDLLNFKIPFPPLKTQQKIADYLDEKCGEIDATIAKQKESIEKLKAYKQSLISETVTKGLDKSAPLKPSGIEWIGDIPAHWEVCKIKNHCNLKTGSTPSSKDLSMFDGTENWFTPSDFTENYMLKNSLRRLNAKVFDQNLVPIFPPLSVLIVGIGATTGKVGFTTSKSSSNQQITAIIPKNKNIFPKFLLFWMIANTKMIRETALFTTLPILNNDTLGNATLLIPPYKEQLELASYIENKNIEIDVIINKKQNIIQKLDAYKKSLIFECVTGKTDL